MPARAAVTGDRKVAWDQAVLEPAGTEPQRWSVVNAELPDPLCRALQFDDRQMSPAFVERDA